MIAWIYVLLFTIGCCLYCAAAISALPVNDRAWDYWLRLDEHDRRWTLPRMAAFGTLVAVVGTLILRGVLYV